MHLHAEKSFGGEFLVVVGEVDSHFAIEPDLNAATLGKDAEFIPIVPLHDALDFFGECLACGIVCGFFLIAIWFFFVVAVWHEPSSPGFIEDAGGPCTIFIVAVFTLVSEDAAGAAVALFGAEHHAGIAGEVVEFEVEAEIKVTVGFVRAEEAVLSEIVTFADDFAIFHGEIGCAANDTPTGEIGAIEEDCEIFFGFATGGKA